MGVRVVVWGFWGFLLNMYETGEVGLKRVVFRLPTKSVGIKLVKPGLLYNQPKDFVKDKFKNSVLRTFRWFASRL